MLLSEETINCLSISGTNTEAKTNFNASLSSLHSLCKKIEKFWCCDHEDSDDDPLHSPYPSFVEDDSPNSTILDKYPSLIALRLLEQLRMALRALFVHPQDEKSTAIAVDDEIRALNRLGFKFHNLNISFHQFLCIATPIERLRNRYWLGESAFPREDDNNPSADSAASTSYRRLCPHKGLHNCVVIADNIRSAFNVGSILRTSECLGVKKVYLCGYTPLPSKEELQHQQQQKCEVSSSSRPLERSALNSDKYLEWEWRRSASQVVDTLLKENYTIVALENNLPPLSSSDSYNGNNHVQLESLFTFKVFQNASATALVLGNERYGIDRYLWSK
mmetsp:Transcript_16750/g.26751  ORF Transcript_16750/g.26751 Transcript_16750/m.26751 type:complete len:333 (+) Transcript_16750:193-1191(+)